MEGLFPEPVTVSATSKSSISLSLLTALTLLPAAGSAQTLSDVKPPPGPLTLKQQGSFFVGGKSVFSDAAGWDLAGALPQYGSGDIMVNQMYVQFQVPQNVKHMPIVLVHGCCLSSKTWETTPDGRMGWYEYFTRQGFPTYLGDQAGRARSGFDGTRFNETKKGADPDDQPPVLMGTAEFAWNVFRFGPSFGEVWPDEQFPMGKVNQLYKQVIPDMILTLVPDLFAELGNTGSRLPTVRHMSTLAKDLGGAILVGHSQSSGFPTKAALYDPTGVKGIIGLETGCFGNLTEDQVEILAKIPILILVGDHFGTQPSPPCVTEKEQIDAAGGDFTFISLPDIGIHGNSHMFMQDKNNLEIANLIIDWIEEHVEHGTS
jgi:pimeloyl-ACP methyl ester carboxylesterase